MIIYHGLFPLSTTFFNLAGKSIFENCDVSLLGKRIKLTKKSSKKFR